MMSWIGFRVVGLMVLLPLVLFDKAYSTQQYPVFTSPKLEVSQNRGGMAEKPSSDVKDERRKKSKSASSKLTNTQSKVPMKRKLKSIARYQYNGFVTVNESRRFFVNAKPLSQHADLKLVSVLNAGRSLVLHHKTRGQINLRLGESTHSNQ